MRVAMISKALVVAAYQHKCELIHKALQAHDERSQLATFVPPHWGAQTLENAYAKKHDLRVIPIRLSGNYHLHHYPTLAQELAEFKPDLVHIDEEPYNLATFLALRAAKKVGARSVLFSWQNLYRHYPPPFRWMEQWVLRHIDAALMGSTEAEQVWQRKYAKLKTHVIPQFGVDEQHFKPRAAPRPAEQPFTIGFAGRLVYEKGVDLLLHAVAALPNARAIILGNGNQQAALHTLANTLGLNQRVEFRPPLPSTRIHEFYHEIDVLALPSRTLPNWKEQFGRVLIEAMACGVPVVGSRCGEIPHVIGDAGLVFTENDVYSLSHALQRLADSPSLCETFAIKGRQRVLNHFTMQSIARQTVQVYTTVVDSR
ncbi:MAG: glycosyltransferase family 4 protein [Anaerolineae bacterium]|nr:glycosyltransferase family 4 protein [Anaerolineae bacterium]